MTKLQKRKNGQFVVTVPKNIAEAYELEGGEDFEWKVKSRNKIEVQIKGGDSRDAA